MKTNNCTHCRVYHHCIKPCWILTAELNRIEYGDQRLKKNRRKIKLIFESDMERLEYLHFINITDGIYYGD